MRVIFLALILVLLLGETFESQENDIDFNFNQINFESSFIANYGKDNTIDKNIAEDSKLDTPDLLRKYGYVAETHSVTTQDGYILQLHRIAGGPASPPRPGKKVVFYMHGILDSSAAIILSGPGRALGYLLADNDYDVWLGNSRGNVYSTNHVTLNPHGSRRQRSKFWSHSFHEIGYYDVPASIDFILGKTNQTKLTYIGHSQGAAVFFVMASTRPEYNDKIEMAHAMAPAVFLSHCKSPIIRVIVPFLKYITRLKNIVGIDYYSPPKWLRRLASKTVCKSPKTQFICESLIFLLAGWNSDQLNKTMVPLIVAHSAAGASINSLIHLGQEVKSGLFRQFDYGWLKNLIKYKRSSPPEYNLKNVKTPTAIYYSRNDWLAAYEDVEQLIPRLPNVTKTYLVPHEKFNHMDFLWGTQAPQLLYNEVLKTLKLNNIKL